MRSWYIVASGILLVIMMSIVVHIRPPSIYPYLLLSLLAGGLLALTIVLHKKAHQQALLVAILLLVFLLLPSVWFISTSYAALTPVDVTYDYAISNTYLEYERAFFFPPGESVPSRWLSSYSGNPALHILSATIANVLGVDTYRVAMFLPSVFATICFLFLYLLATRLCRTMGITTVVIPLTILVSGISAHAIFFGSRFVRTSLALPLLMMGFYLICKYMPAGGKRTLGLITFSALMLVVTHHLSSVVFAVYLVSFLAAAMVAFALLRMAKPKWQELAAKLPQRALAIGIVGIVAVGAFIGWDYFAPRILQPPPAVIAVVEEPAVVKARWSAVVAESMAKIPALISEPEAYVPMGRYHEQLTPPWVRILLARDILVYFPVFLGFSWLIMWLIRAKMKLSHNQVLAAFFFMFSLLVFGVFTAIDLFLTHIDTYRIVLIALPLIAFGSAVFYSWLWGKSKHALFVILVFVIVCSSLGLWGHRLVPLHAYTSAVNPAEVGDAMPLDARHHAVGDFLNGHVICGATEIISDDMYALYPLVPPAAYGKITGMASRAAVPEPDEIARLGSRTTAVVNFSVPPWSCWYSMRTTPGTLLARKSEYYSALAANFNKIYTNGFEIWLR